MNELNKLYAAILKAADCTIDDNGEIYLHGEPVTVEFEGKVRPVILPTAENLKNADWNHVIGFHPACESVFCGHSAILNKLTNILSLKLYRSVLTATEALLLLALNTEAREKIGLQQQKLLLEVGDCSNKVIDYFRQVVKTTTGFSGNRVFLTLHLARNRKVGDERFDNVCSLNVPILGEPDPIWDIKGSNANRLAFRKALALSLPQQLICGTNSKKTPCLDVVLDMFVTTARHLNALRNTLGKNYCGNLTTIDISWYEDLARLSDLKEKYLNQSLPGNRGKSENTTKKSTGVEIPIPKMPKTPAPEETAETAPVRQPVAPTAVAPPPVQQQAQAPQQSQGPSMLDSLMDPPQPPMGMGMGQPWQQSPPMMMQSMQQPMQPYGGYGYQQQPQQMMYQQPMGGAYMQPQGMYQQPNNGYYGGSGEPMRYNRMGFPIQSSR